MLPLGFLSAFRKEKTVSPDHMTQALKQMRAEREKEEEEEDKS